jgi:hypothetical protein
MSIIKLSKACGACVHSKVLNPDGSRNLDEFVKLVVEHSEDDDLVNCAIDYVNHCCSEKAKATINNLYEQKQRRRRWSAALRIQRAWRRAVADPELVVCRRRLMREFVEMG